MPIKSAADQKINCLLLLVFWLLSRYYGIDQGDKEKQKPHDQHKQFCVRLKVMKHCLSFKIKEIAFIALMTIGLTACENPEGGFIDRNGNYVVKAPNQWEMRTGTSFSDGLVKFRNDDGKLGYMDRTGKVVIEAQYFDPAEGDIGDFSEGLAAVSYDGKTYGYIDEHGTMVIQPIINTEGSTDMCLGRSLQFDQGLLRVGMASPDGVLRYGYMNRSGGYVVKPQFECADYFSEGLAAVSYDGKKYGFIDKTGKLVIKPRFDGDCQFSEGLAAVHSGNKGGYIDKTGRFAIKPVFNIAHDFSEGLALVSYDGKKYGFIDKSGKLVIKPQFSLPKDTDSIQDDDTYYLNRDFSEGLAAITYDGKTFGLIDKTGKLIIKPQFRFLKDRHPQPNFSDGLAAVTYDGKSVGYLNGQGQVVIKPQFDAEYAGDFSEGLAAVPINNKYGYIDKTGQLVIKSQFASAGPFHEGLAHVYKRGTFDFLGDF